MAAPAGGRSGCQELRWRRGGGGVATKPSAGKGRGGKGGIVRKKTVFEEKSDIRRLAAQKSRSAQRYELRPVWLLRSRGRPSRGAAGRCRRAAGKRAWGSGPRRSYL